MTRRRFALDFLILMTLAGLAVALNGCSARRQAAAPDESAGVVQAGEVGDRATQDEAAPAAAGGHDFGRIASDGRYTAPDGSFSVGPPHLPTSYEFQNMRYTDGVRSSDDVKLRYVIFGPGPSDPTAYHVVLATGLGAAVDVAGAAARSRTISDAYMRRYQARHGGSSRLVAFEEAVVAGRPGGYAVYRHDPAGPDGAGFYVAFMITDHGEDGIVNVMAEKLTPANPWYPGKETLLAGSWTRFNTFAASVQLGNY